MKNSLIVSSVFALVSIVLAALVLAGLGALSAPLALPLVAVAFAGLAVLATRSETVVIAEEYETVKDSWLIVDSYRIDGDFSSTPASFVAVLGSFVLAFVGSSVVFAALLLAGFGVVAL